ncbi:hypothetical protein CARUB_v10016109mg [Capsella rubella]|uniref:RING-type E3 ubiquitin transferase n=1 Tax=Capsella rubella TaxID=81985 RepID=R0I8F4_9BRAS|nr:hypothetical protein CARUB_v10016109mg [Capsella rubella]
MEEEEEVVLGRPLSRVYCRQRYYLREGEGLLVLKVEISIVEEGLGSRQGRLFKFTFISHPVMEEHERQVILGFLTSSGIREEDADFMITSISCFGCETIALNCQSLGGCLTLYMNILVGVDHYKNIRRGIKVDQGCRIIKADQYNGVWDSDSLVVDHEEGWDNVVLFNIDDNNTLKYTFRDSIQLDPLAIFSDYKPRLKPASESAIRRLKKSWMEETIGCTICFDELVVGAEASTLPCRHHFHKGCIVEWLKTSHFCPLCRFALPAQP